MFSYVLSTKVGKVRLLIADTAESSAIFEDEEIEAYLSMASNDINLAGAKALESICADKAKLAKKVKVGGYETETHALADIMALATRLRNDSSQGQAETITIEAKPEHLDYYL